MPDGPSQPTRYCARKRPRRAGRHVGDLRGHAVVVLDEAIEPRVVGEGHARQRARVIAEDRIEIDLRAGAGGLRREVALVALREGRHLEPQQLLAAHAFEIDEVARIALRPHRGAHRLRHAPAAAELHVARAHHALLGHVDGAVALFDQHAVDAALAEVAGEPEADRPGADNDDRGFLVVVHSRRSRLGRAARRRYPELSISGGKCLRQRAAIRRARQSVTIMLMGSKNGFGRRR